MLEKRQFQLVFAHECYCLERNIELRLQRQRGFWTKTFRAYSKVTPSWYRVPKIVKRLI